MPRYILLILVCLSTGCSNSLKLSQWRDTVGPPIVFAPTAMGRAGAGGGRLLVVNWNMHVGNGDIKSLIDDLSKREASAGFARPEFVFLLQESFRRGPEVRAPGDYSVPRRIAPPASGLDIEDVAGKLGWWMYYVPSMRNGSQVGDMAEDRGNAILSSLPLESLEAVELPFVVQRRVALIATVTDAQKRPRLRVAVVHLDTRAPLTEGWIFGGPAGRNQQVKEIVTALKKLDDDKLPLVLGGDFNSQLGSREAAVGTVAQFAAHADCGRQATHTSGFVLDHVFVRMSSGQKAPQCARLDGTFGSDHYPLVLPLPLER